MHRFSNQILVFHADGLQMGYSLCSKKIEYRFNLTGLLKRAHPEAGVNIIFDFLLNFTHSGGSGLE